MPELKRTFKPYWTTTDGETVRLHHGDVLDVLRLLPARSVHTCVTSPPYWGLRDYKAGSTEIGQEKTPDLFVDKMVEVFREVRRVLRNDGTLWLNLGDSYGAASGRSDRDNLIPRPDGTAGKPTQKHDGTRVANVTSLPSGNLVGVPWRVALALQADGWVLRQDIIWAKPSPMPESVRNRCTKAHEYIFLLTKGMDYYYDAEAIKEESNRAGEIPGGKKYASVGWATSATLNDGPVPSNSNKRSVWIVASAGYPGAHFATYPPKLIEPCILAGCPVGGTVLDPFMGSGTTAAVAVKHGRRAVGIDLSEEYLRNHAIPRITDALRSRPSTAELAVNVVRQEAPEVRRVTLG